MDTILGKESPMARHAENKVHLRELEKGRWLLYGRVFGEKIRKRYKTGKLAMAAKGAMEQAIIEKASQFQTSRHLAQTIFDDAQLRKIEAYHQLCTERGISWDAFLESGLKHAHAGHKAKVESARAEWYINLKARHRADRTLEKNKGRLDAFLATLPEGTTHVADITPEMVEKWVLRPNVAPLSQLTDGRVVSAFFRFCMKRGWLTINPCQVDLGDLGEQARPNSTPRILSVEECERLWHATERAENGALKPFIALSLWCFMRKAEVLSTTANRVHLVATPPFVEVFPHKRGTVRYRTVDLPENMLEHAMPKWWAGRAALSENRQRRWYCREMMKERPAEALAYALKRGVYVPELPETHQFIPAHPVEGDPAPYFCDHLFDRVRREAKVYNDWDENLLRHTGMSYLYQRLSAKAQAGTFNRESVIAEVTRQAGNSDATAFRHYLSLPKPGAYEGFYAIGRK